MGSLCWSSVCATRTVLQEYVGQSLPMRWSVTSTRYMPGHIHVVS